MSTTTMESIVRRVFKECLNGRRLDVADETIAADFVWNNTQVGREGFKRNFSAIFKAFPGIYWTIEELIARGDQALFRVGVSGMPQDERRRAPPDGHETTIKGTAICRCADGKIAALWQFADDLDLIQSLDADVPMSAYNTWIAHGLEHDHPKSMT